MAVTSVRGNSIPSGGVAATSEPTQGYSLLPDTRQLQMASENFMECSEMNCISLNSQALAAGQQVNFKIQNVGMGHSLELLLTGSVSLANTAAAKATISLAPEFPFNIFSNILTQFNGATVLHSLSGYELLGIMSKRSKNMFLGAAASNGAAGTSQEKARVDKTMAWIEAGANMTLVSGDGLTGISSIEVAAASTGIVNFGCYLELPYVLRDDLLLGLLPMQNNSVYANVAVTVPQLLGTTAKNPFFVANAVPATLTVSASTLNLKPTYNFWSIPNPNDARLYQYFVAHSYMLLSQPANAINNTGDEALQYGMPNNYYLMALLLTIRDSTSGLVNIEDYIDNPYLSYNGTARVDRREIKTRMARQHRFYEGIATSLGQLLWDATDVAYLANGTNTTKWLDMYKANNPQFVADIKTGFSTAGSFSVLREQIVPATVQII